MKTSSLVVYLCLLVAGCGNEPRDYISVSGAATVKVPIDYFQIRVSVTSKASSFSKANEHNKKVVMRFFQILSQYRVGDSDFVTIQSNANQNDYGYEDQRPTVVYSGNLTLRNPNMYDDLFQALMSLGDVEVTILSYGSVRIEEYQSKAYGYAIQSAKTRAEMLLSGTKSRVGKVMRVLYEGRDYLRTGDEHADMEVAESTIPIVAKETAVSAPRTFKRKDFDLDAYAKVVFAIE